MNRRRVDDTGVRALAAHPTDASRPPDHNGVAPL